MSKKTSAVKKSAVEPEINPTSLLGRARKLRRHSKLCWLVLIATLLYFSFCIFIYVNQPNGFAMGTIMALLCYSILSFAFSGLLDSGKWPVVFSTTFLCNAVGIVFFYILLQGFIFIPVSTIVVLFMMPLYTTAMTSAIWRWGWK